MWSTRCVRYTRHQGQNHHLQCVHKWLTLINNINGYNDIRIGMNNKALEPNVVFYIATIDVCTKKGIDRLLSAGEM